VFFRVLAVMHMHMMNSRKKNNAPPREHTIINQTGQLVTLFVASVNAFLLPTGTPDVMTSPVIDIC
jgi:hypothetical protein